jgi:DNA-binding beta-propeller fold protein YncE
MRIHQSSPLALLTLVALTLLPGCDAGEQSVPDLIWGIHGRKPGWLVKPRAAVFDATDHLYVVDLTDRVQVFDREGKYLRGWRMPDFNVDGPSGVSIDRNGRLLVADTHFYRVLVFSPEGKILLQIGDGVQGTTPGRFGYPCDVVADKAGNFYVADYGENDRVQVFSPQGKWLRQWGGHGYEPGQFVRPRALAIDDQDRLYVADSVANRIQVFDTKGKPDPANSPIPTMSRLAPTARSTSASMATTGSRSSRPKGSRSESGESPAEAQDSFTTPGPWPSIVKARSR